MTRLRRCVLGGGFIVALAFVALAATAQTAFDMGQGVAPAGAAVEPAFDMRNSVGTGSNTAGGPAFEMGGSTDQPAGAATLPSATFSPGGAPFGMPSGAPAAGASPATGSPSVEPFQMVPGRPVAELPVQAETPARPRTPDRFIVPLPRLRFEGESTAHGWVTYFTEQEVQRAATLLVGYTNAIYVMPELSRLRVTINGQLVMDLPIASPGGTSQISAAIPPGVLRAGGNLIRFEMHAVHRTDCSIESTYQLWTELDNSETGIAFQGGPAPAPAMIDDLPAIGVDPSGSTHIRFIHDGPIEPHYSNQILLASQALALRGRYAHPVVSIVGPDAGPPAPGTLSVVVGSAENLRNSLAFPPPIAPGQPLVRFVNDTRTGGPALVLGGETASAVEAANARLTAGIGTADDDKLSISSRFAPDAPFFTGAGSARFSDMGVQTQEFSGRRLRIRFPVGLPADFYGAANGQAEILLDAAYAPSVRPGSRLSVYVNGTLASSYQLNERHGGLLQHKVIKIPLTHFRAGINRIWMEVLLNVDSDAVCGPGATLAREQRFVLFDSSRFVMGEFARIGTSPNLAAFFGRGYPYFHDTQPVAVVMRHDAPTVAAAATVLARLALSHEDSVPVDTSPAAASLADRPALFIGDINQISPDVLRQVGVVQASRIRWLADSRPGGGGGRSASETGAAASASTPPPSSFSNLESDVRERSGSGNENIYDRWRDEVAGQSAIGAELLRFETWVRQTFDISLGVSSGGDAEPFNPPPRTSVLVAQGFAPNSDATWTLIAGHTAESLAAAIDEFTMPEYWLRAYGQAVAFDASSRQMEIRTPGSQRFIVTQPLGPSNLRLIAANWLSLNIVTYALVLTLCCIAFAIVTSLLLRRRW